MNFYKWLHHRASGRRPQIGSGDNIMRKVYNAIEMRYEWNDLVLNNGATSEYGAIFNLEFCPDGNILAAACEKKAILLFDAVSQKQTHRIMNAHDDNVNCIKFLDKSTFGTCSDDTTVAIWDIRCLKNRVRTLRGHSNWVKNIEYSSKEGLLVTSGFDGSIFTWDINSHTEEGLIYQKVFNTSGLMRCRISPDCTKLVMSTTGGYLMIIHDLDLTTLHKDLCGFRPNIFRLMQMGNQYIPQAAKFNHIFSKKQKRNRVELVSDFPSGNDAEVVLALQMHPKGLSFLSRNVSYDEQTEWSCIHDLNEESYDLTIPKPSQKRKRKPEKDDENDGSNPSKSKIISNGRGQGISANNEESASTSAGIRPSAPLVRRSNGTDDSEPNVLRSPSVAWGVISTTGVDFSIRPGYGVHARPVVQGRSPRRSFNTSNNQPVNNRRRTSQASNHVTFPAWPPPQNPQQSRPEFVPDIWAAEITIQERAARQARGSQTNSVTGYDFVYAISSGILPARFLNPGDPNSISINSENNGNRHILQNANKLMFYIQESTNGKGFIKEPSFSSDGRIICSPYDNGVRLFSYSENCSEHPQWAEADALKKEPKKLVEIKNISCHSDIVLSSAFCPTQPLLVTGCKYGKVTWYYPKL